MTEAIEMKPCDIVSKIRQVLEGLAKLSLDVMQDEMEQYIS